MSAISPYVKSESKNFIIDSSPSNTMATPRVLMLRSITLTKFSGKTSWSQWLPMYEDYVTASTPAATDADKARFLRFYVEGPAEAFLQTLSRDTSYADTCAFMAAKFTTSAQTTVARSQLKECKQRSTESVLDFVDRLTRIIQNVVDASTSRGEIEKRIAQEFIDRVRPDISLQLIAQGIESLEQAVQRARTLESVLPPQSTRPEILRLAQVDGQQHPTHPPTRPVQPFLHLPQRDFQRRNRDGINCYNCGKRGHISRECWSRQEHFDNLPQDYNQRSDRFPDYEDRRHEWRNPSPRAPNNRQSDNNWYQGQGRIAMLNQKLNETETVLDEVSTQMENIQLRNRQLASMTCGKTDNNNSPPFRINRIRKLGLATIAMITLILIPIVGAHSGQAEMPMICQTTNARYFLSLNRTLECPSLEVEPEDEPTAIRISIWKPNVERYEQAASYCRIVKSSAYFYRGFFGGEYEHYEATDMPVSTEECRMMEMNKRCSHGLMSEVEGKWATQNKFEYTHPSNPFACCSNNTIVITNCYLTYSSIHAAFGSTAIFSPAGDMHGCNYDHGSCALRDGATLVWTPSFEQKCAFIEAMTVNGHQTGPTFLDESGEIALSWDRSYNSTYNCEKYLMIVTHQGLAVLEHQLADPEIIKQARQDKERAIRNKRNEKQTLLKEKVDNAYDVDVFRTAQFISPEALAASLSAVEVHIREATKFAFTKAFRLACNTWRTQIVAQRTTFLANPTLAVRSLTGHPYVFASASSVDLVEAWPCMPLPENSFKFVPMGSECSSYPRIQYRDGNKTIEAGVDPQTLIVHHIWPQQECALVREIPIRIFNNLLIYEASSGSLKQIDTHTVSEIGTPVNQENPDGYFPFKMFHAITIRNLSNSLPSPVGGSFDVIQVNDMARRTSRNLDSNVRSMPYYALDDAIKKIVNENDGKWEMPDWSGWATRAVFGRIPTMVDAWVYTVCAIVTAYILIRAAIIGFFIYANMGNIPTIIGQRYHSSALRNLVSNVRQMGREAPYWDANADASIRRIIERDQVTTAEPISPGTMSIPIEEEAEPLYSQPWKSISMEGPSSLTPTAPIRHRPAPLPPTSQTPAVYLDIPRVRIN
ncbi:unnamed protein product [Caenorhabditis angaria]|uniref:CCHC-type domain-containing protein n=1 Tax=Caenorhabditis angaria TaxID=860376 RepID=A0A9P1I7Y4_9PELO|nr:unnamed protein product [Caenorhabditis angaria]